MGAAARRSPTRPRSARDPGRLRVAMSAENPLGAPADAESRARRCARPRELLASLGHEVEEARAAVPGPEALRAVQLRSSVPAIALAGRLRRAARRPPAGGGRGRAAVARDRRAVARTTPASATWRALAQLQALARGVVAFFAEYDLLLTPVLAERPLAIGELHRLRRGPDGRLRPLGRSSRPSPRSFNVTGQPAISVPAGFGEDGLPTACSSSAGRWRGHAAAGRRPARGRAAVGPAPPRGRRGCLGFIPEVLGAGPVAGAGRQAHPAKEHFTHAEGRGRRQAVISDRTRRVRTSGWSTNIPVLP